MRALLYSAAWEFINIALEYTVSSWKKLPRWFAAVVTANLATHPAFAFVLARCGHTLQVVLPCEAVIVCVEALLLMAIYGFSRWRLLVLAPFAMNAASYLTGTMMSI